MENLRVWNKYKEVPANALKNFDNGRFKGTDINTMWRLKMLTEEYGPCGIGWYYDIIRIWNVEIPEESIILTFAEIKLYVKDNGEWSKGISGVGGNTMLSITKDGRLKPNDEAVKMAVTDAIGVACKNLGFGADVYWENDKTKYTSNCEDGQQPDDNPESTLPTIEQLTALKKIKRTLAHVAKVNNIDEKAVTSQHVADYIAKVIAYQKQKEAEKDKQLNDEALRTFGGGDDE